MNDEKLRKPRDPVTTVDNMIVKAMEGIYNDPARKPEEKDKLVYDLLAARFERGHKLKDPQDQDEKDMRRRMARNYAELTLDKLKEKGMFDHTVL